MTKKPTIPNPLDLEEAAPVEAPSTPPVEDAAPPLLMDVEPAPGLTYRLGDGTIRTDH